MTIGEERSKVFNSSGYHHQREEGVIRQSRGDCATMLAQQRLPVHLEYLQPHLTSPETKASPLALLAATCSSIGKTDSDKKETKTTSTILNKLSMREEGSKSSFKPYKFDEKPTILRTSPPTLTSNTSLLSLKASTVSSSLFQSRLQTTMSVSESERGRCIPEQLTRDHKEHYPMLLKCHTRSPPLPPHLPPTMLSPHRHHHHDHGECIQCKPIRPHSDPLPIRTPSTQGPPCPCPSCNQSRGDPKCHYPPASIASLYPPYKNPHLQPMITCRDPTCTNCSKLPPSHSSVQNFLHPALIHQCTHGAPHKTAYPPPPPPLSSSSTHIGSYETYIKSATPNTKPYVCNWVSDGKHCGNGFTTSEELFQHLRTHTSLQQQQQQQQQTNCDSHSTTPQPSTNSCTIHGCPCGQRKSSPRPAMSGFNYGPVANNVRYTPYSRPGHGYVVPPHSSFHY